MPKRSKKGHYISKAERDAKPLSDNQKGFLDHVLDMYVLANKVNFSRI